MSDNPIPEKFQRDTPEETAQAILESYSHLESELGKKTSELNDLKNTPAPKPQEQPVQIPQKGEPSLTWETFQTKIQDGSLTDDDYNAMVEGYKIPRTLLERSVNAIKNENIVAAQRVTTLLGGEENVQKVLEFAKQNFSEQEINNINKDLQDPSKVDITLLGLAAKAGITPQASEQDNPNSLDDSVVSPGGEGVQPFKNNEEFRDAMKDPKYKTDKNYQQLVLARLAKTKAAQG